MATLYPEQGEWSEEDYLELTDHAKRRIEFTEGRLEFLPKPTEAHEAITQFLFLALYQRAFPTDMQRRDPQAGAPRSLQAGTRRQHPTGGMNVLAAAVAAIDRHAQPRHQGIAEAVQLFARRRPETARRIAVAQ